jgi:tRNA (adenine57-N1/adenine58-N1)-methyltransferase
MRRDLMQEGDLVVIFQSFDNLSFIYLTCPSSDDLQAKQTNSGVVQNANGTFHHVDMIGQSFGCKLHSRSSDGWVYCLRPTPELWARSLNHRTQIVHELDQSLIVFHLEIRPGSIVLESGTGSGAMSTAFMRALAPTGHLYTYEFNESRVLEARKEFERNKIGHLSTVTHRDVCGKLNPEEGGFTVEPGTADACFLDLPEPWLAAESSAKSLKPNGRLCSYSPCIEQSQRCVLALEGVGFHTFKTIEVRLKEYHVDEVQQPAGGGMLCPVPFYYGIENISKHNKSGGGGGGEEKGNSAKKRKGRSAEPYSDESKRHFARPFQDMRGHTAFLTFATNSLKDGGLGGVV